MRDLLKRVGGGIFGHQVKMNYWLLQNVTNFNKIAQLWNVMLHCYFLI